MIKACYNVQYKLLEKKYMRNSCLVEANDFLTQHVYVFLATNKNACFLLQKGQIDNLLRQTGIESHSMRHANVGHVVSARAGILPLFSPIEHPLLSSRKAKNFAKHLILT